MLDQCGSSIADLCAYGKLMILNSFPLQMRQTCKASSERAVKLGLNPNTLELLVHPWILRPTFNGSLVPLQPGATISPRLNVLLFDGKPRRKAVKQNKSGAAVTRLALANTLSFRPIAETTSLSRAKSSLVRMLGLQSRLLQRVGMA